eukprot:TRINITY_DN29076_c0_g1_i1.p1 TRINITY_DN29076_c0_g1~~TRINITY_DN29076_c0_g1_i1.p1  ORF type:complete len:393 (+),score=79.24 TRINITY_DN29076_c0_g1_i1:29-1180(+)
MLESASNPAGTSTTMSETMEDAMSQGGSSSSGCSSRSEFELDPETEALINQAPLSGHIGHALELSQSLFGPGIGAVLSGLGAGIAHWKHLKTSFHATYLLDLSPPLVVDGISYSRVIAQVIGASMGDKALWMRGPTQAATLSRSAQIAQAAGVRVPTILAMGQVDSVLDPLDVVIEEFIQTQTVEDEVAAPSGQWHNIVDEVLDRMQALSLKDTDVKPLPHFQSLSVWLQWLLEQVPDFDVPLSTGLALFAEDILRSPPPPQEARLIHQDVNTGNVLCSEGSGGAWKLDAVIDWESAAVADPRSLSNKEPWRTARAFSYVVKGSLLAEAFVHGRLPRCELEQLVEGYDRAAHELNDSGWLAYQSWALRVRHARTAGVDQFLKP